MKNKDTQLLEEAYQAIREGMLDKLNPFKKQKQETSAERFMRRQSERDEKEKAEFIKRYKDEPRLNTPYENYSISHWRGVFPTAGEPESDHYIVLDHESSQRYPSSTGDTYSSEEQAMEAIQQIEANKKRRNK